MYVCLHRCASSDITGCSVCRCYESFITAHACAQVKALTVESLLSGILCMRVQHYTQQLALVGVLDMLLKQQPQVNMELDWVQLPKT